MILNKIKTFINKILDNLKPAISRDRRIPLVMVSSIVVATLVAGAVGLSGGMLAEAEIVRNQIVEKVTEEPENEPEINSKAKPESNSEPTSDTPLTSEELYLMARVIEGEAANEPYMGKVAVGAVIMNRARHKEFPDSISNVVYQPMAFCVVRTGLINRTPTEESLRAARAAAQGTDPTGGALYFFNPSKKINPWMWDRTHLAKIGNHNFAR